MSLRRIAVPLAVLLAAVAGLFGLIALFADRDESTFDRTAGPGVAASAPTGSERGLLSAGNVVIEHPGTEAPAELAALRSEISGPDSAALRRSGQAIVLRAGSERIARAWKRELRYRDASDPQLREFVEFWLGRGSPR